MNLQLIKQDKFNDILVDVYRNDNNEVFMTAKQLGEALEYSTKAQAIINIINRNDYLKEQEFSVQLNLGSTDGKQYDTRLLTEDGIYEVTMLSKQPKAVEFRRFIRELLKGLRKGEIKLLAPDAKPQDQLLTLLVGAKFIADDLRVNDISRLGMYRDIHAQAGLPTGHILPYVKSNGVLKSATVLLKENGSPMSAIKFNQRMVAKGLLEERTRPSSKGGVKKFKCLTDKGLEYGENLASPHNPKEVQPHYFDNTFTQLLELIND